LASSSQAIVQPSAATASRSMHSQARGTPRGCRPVCRSGRVDGGIDSAMRTSARQPSATAPSRCRFLCGASPAAAECDACASRPGWMPHHCRGRRAHTRAGTGVDRVRLAAEESHRPGPGLLANHFDSRRSGGLRVGRPAHHRSDAVCSRAWRDRWDSDLSACRHTRPSPSNCPRRHATNQLRRSAPASSEARSASDPRCLRVANRAGARQQVIPDPQPSSFGNICHGIPLRSTKTMPVRHARSGTRGRPPFGRGGEGGRSGSMRFHSASGNSTSAINRRR
jgi:hypothetical protein